MLVEHLRAGRMECPEAAFGQGIFSRHSCEAGVDAEDVADCSTPCWPSFAVVGECLNDVLAHFPYCKHLDGGLHYCHGNKCKVGVGWSSCMVDTTLFLLSTIFSEDFPSAATVANK